MKEVIPQILGIVGMVVIVSSFQCKSNRNFFMLQGIGSIFFFFNFLLIGAYGGALFNLVNNIRGMLFLKNPKAPWKGIVIAVLYTLSFAFSVYVNFSVKQIILVFLPYITLIIMTIFMQKGNAKHIRIFQIGFMSPAWIIHNCFNLSVGGIICEAFNMVSSAIYLVKTRKTK